MPLNRILILIVVIFISVGILCFIVENSLKSGKKQEKVEEEKPKTEPQKEMKEEPKEVEKKEELKEVEKREEKKEKTHAPAVSIALQNEFDDFKNYLHEKLGYKKTTEEKEEKYVESENFDMNDNFDMNNFNYYDDDMNSDDYISPYRRRKEFDKNFEDLPNEIKILLFSNFFDSKF